MKLTKLYLVPMAFATLTVVSSGAALADSKYDTFTVKASVVAKCTIDTTAASIDFGSYDAFSTTDYAVSSTVSIACTKGAPDLTLALSGGAKPTTIGGATMNQMSGASDLLAYGLYQDSDHTTPWHGTSRKIASATKNAVPYTIYGVVPKGQNVSVGDYSDTVTATINF